RVQGSSGGKAEQETVIPTFGSKLAGAGSDGLPKIHARGEVEKGMELAESGDQGLGGSDTHDEVCACIDVDVLADDVGVRSVAATPKPVADHNYFLQAGLLFAGSKGTAAAEGDA